MDFAIAINLNFVQSNILPTFVKGLSVSANHNFLKAHEFTWRFVESSDPLWKGYFYTVLIIIATVATTVINNQYAFKQWMIGLQVKTFDIFRSNYSAKSIYWVDRNRLKKLKMGVSKQLNVLNWCCVKNTSSCVVCLWYHPMLNTQVQTSNDSFVFECKHFDRGELWAENFTNWNILRQINSIFLYQLHSQSIHPKM